MLVCGRRWGKTILAERQLAETALAGQPVAYLCPTYRMLTQVWRDLAHMLGSVAKLTVSEYRMDVQGGGSIDMWSGDDMANAIRGRKYALVVIDEAALIPGLQTAWEQSIRPTLTDLRGKAWFISTPRRGGAFETLYEGAQGEGWARWQMPTSANPYIAADELDVARQGMSEQAYAQEYLADFESSETDLVHILDRAKTIADPPQRWADCKAHVVGIDPGGGDLTAIVPLGVSSVPYRGHMHHIHQYGEFGRSNVPISWIAERLTQLQRDAGKQILVPVGETGGDVITQTLQELGFKAFKATMGREGIQTMQWLYETGQLTIDHGCKDSIAEFGLYRWKKIRDPETAERFNTSIAGPTHGDYMDARRYAAVTIIQSLQNRAASVVRTEYR